MPLLESTSPAEAVELYIEDRKPEIAKSTVYEHRCRLNRFLEWVEAENPLEDMTEMTRRKAQQYKVHRSGEVAPSTVETEHEPCPNGDPLCDGPDGEDLPCFPCFRTRGGA